MDIGLFGGTFNPFHNGHIGIIKHVRQVFGLEKIFLIPSKIPPHKPGINLAPADQRFKMVQKSLENENGLFVSDKELIRTGPSFTIDTITEFQSECGSEVRLFFILGSDAFFDIDTWKEKDRILEAVPIIIMLRGEKDTLLSLTSFIDENISKRYIYDQAINAFVHEKRQCIYICKVPKIDISSTMIRKRIQQKKPVTGLVPEPVEAIIKQEELYQ